MAWLQVGVEWLAHGLLWVVDAFSRVPGAVFSFRFDFPAMLVAYGMLLAILLYGHTGRFALFARHSVFVVNYTSCPGD